MASNINPTKPDFGSATVESVQDNFQIAATEITALQDKTAGITTVSVFGGSLISATSAADGRTVLELGSAATTSATSYATATQGALADSAVQPEDLAAVATSGDYNDLQNLPTLGTAAALDVGTTASNVVQLDSGARLPAVDGSQLTGIGDVVGPASSTVNAFVLFATTSGKLVKEGTWSESGGVVTAGSALDLGGRNLWGASSRVNNIGTTATTAVIDLEDYNTWYFEPTGNITVNVTNVPTIGSGAVLGYMVITGGGDHTITFQCEGGSGSVVTEGGSGLTFATGTGYDVVGILQVGTDTVWLKVLNAEALS